MTTRTIDTIALDMKKIASLFDKYDNQYDVLIAIYTIAFPDWDDIESIDGSPTVSSTTWQDICGLFIDFDEKHHPSVFSGGIWMNRGFDTGGNTEDGVVDISSARVVYKGVLRENFKSG